MMTLLPHIDSPDDVKKLATAQLPRLAQEMREHLIETLAPIGGHLGASLGVVELTIALHYVFSSPKDKIIWDVSHQAYPHKMLTGRLSKMPTIRQYGGLSGFTKRSESVHDVFGAGHASTSISAAYGLALARDLQQKKGDVVAVIGDGALSGGMALEALNHAGARNNRMLIILNDNEMSISPNVGAVSAYLSRVITGKPYTSAKDMAKKLLDVLPSGALEAVRRVEEHVKGMIVQGTLFEELGVRYLGPIDGHDFEHLIPVLQNYRQLSGPVILHVLTRKGLGYSPAEADPETWHGLGPYNPQKGMPIPNASTTFTSVFSDALCTMAAQNSRIVAITAAMPTGTGLSAFAKRFPERFFDVGIAEQHAVTFAAGLAADGMRPVVAIYSTFMQRAYDQIVHDVCIQRLPVIFCMDRAGVVGADGATHTGLLDIAFMRSIPEMLCMAAADEQELVDMLATALAWNQGPCAIRYPRGKGVNMTLQAASVLPVGKAVLHGDGDDGLVIVVGTRLHDAQCAIERLEEDHGLQFSLLNLRFIKPLDEAAITRHAQQGLPVMVVEEGVKQGGVGECIAALLLQHGWQGAFHHAAMPDSFPAHGTQAEILRDLTLDADGLYQRLLTLTENR